MRKRYKFPILTETSPGQFAARLCPDDVVLCDFCMSEEPVAGEVEAEDFTATDAGLLGLPNISRGCWAACNECLTLLEADDWKELLKRSVTHFFINQPELNHPDVAQLVRDEINQLHKNLRTHMKGVKRYA